jgi:hypothetical protein
MTSTWCFVVSEKVVASEVTNWGHKVKYWGHKVKYWSHKIKYWGHNILVAHHQLHSIGPIGLTSSPPLCPSCRCTHYCINNG